MGAGLLSRQRPESVQLLTAVPGPANRLGESVPSWAPGPAQHGRVQPLLTEEAVQRGLTTERERLKIYLTAQVVTLPARLRLREQDWTVIRAEPWPSHTLLVVEGVR
jgi:hypothetical protein